MKYRINLPTQYVKFFESFILIHFRFSTFREKIFPYIVYFHQIIKFKMNTNACHSPTSKNGFLTSSNAKIIALVVCLFISKARIPIGNLIAGLYPTFQDRNFAHFLSSILWIGTVHVVFDKIY